MKKRDIGILIGLGIVVLLAAWWFLIISPMRDDIESKQNEYSQQKQTYDQNMARVQRIDEERLAARQASSDLLSLNKLIPANEQVPSMIIEMQSTANDAGIKFMKIVPDTPIAGTGGGTVVPFELDFQGQIFDVNDFLYRVENFARMQGNEVDVTGRLISVVTIDIGEPSIADQFPKVLVKMGANAYMTQPPPAKPGTGGASPGASAAGGAGAGGSAGGGATAGP